MRLKVSVREALGQLPMFGVTRVDLLLTAGLLALCAVMLLGLHAMLPAPQYASIRVDGTEVCRLPLDVDTVYRISEHNQVEIRDGTVCMLSADCPDKVCLRTGRISRSGQSIVCAPNRTVVTIVGGKGEQADWQTY